MVQLRATGEHPVQRVERSVPEGAIVRIGRAPKSGWAVPWDVQISREHVDVHWLNGKLTVQCLDDAKNPILYHGQPAKKLALSVGEAFQIGQTSFVVVSPDPSSAKKEGESPGGDLATVEMAVDPGDEGVDEFAFSEEDLKKVDFGNTVAQMEILARLPRLISSSQADEELAVLLVGLLLDAMPQAVAVAVVRYDETDIPGPETEKPAGGETANPAMLRVQTRENYTGRFRPSRRLILKTLAQQSSFLHIFSGDEAADQFTVSDSLGWAFGTPVRGDSCKGWCLYVSGEGGKDGALLVGEDDLKGDVRFTELMAQFIGSIRQVRMLQEHKTQLATFFSPKVMENLTNANAQNALMPEERDISVLFCDVRGFSRKSEKLKDDLHKLLKSVSEALGVMANGILERDGAIADFQGDAALGFWGWPVALAEGPVPACRAALAIYEEFAKAVDHANGLLEGFSVGVGIAHGRAIAGQIGTSAQAKVGVFGPVVNQGSRMEGMSKQFGVPIVVDETTADFAARFLEASEGRCFPLARVRPKGMDMALTVNALLPPEDQYEAITDGHITDYTAAVDAIIQGHWADALGLLEGIPDDQGPKQFLINHMAEFEDKPPDGWDGAFSLKSK